LCCIQLPLPAKTDTERETLRERKKEIVLEREREAHRKTKKGTNEK
jgi:hypothetical protein